MDDAALQMLSRMIEYSEWLENLSNEDLVNVIFDEIYYELKFDRKEAIISEVIMRLSE